MKLFLQYSLSFYTFPTISKLNEFFSCNHKEEPYGDVFGPVAQSK